LRVLKINYSIGSVFLRWMLSAPIYFKIMGIGALIAFIFGGVTLYQVRKSMSAQLYKILEQRTLTMATSLSNRIESPLVTNDVFSVHQILRKTVDDSQDILYIIVEDPDGRVIAHTFPGAVPSDLNRIGSILHGDDADIQIFESGEILIFEATVPIITGHAGALRIGTSDQSVSNELSETTKSIVFALALCMVIGEALALVLTYILTRPIHHLVESTKKIEKGDFDYRAEVFAGDEIGKLAQAFNHMAGGLSKYRDEVQNKEAALEALIEKIVFAQEEERKRIARDLHDQLGQSLLAFLLTIQAAGKDRECPTCIGEDLAERTRQLIDEVRDLAWDIRPSILDDYGLELALQRYVEEAGKRSFIKFDYQCHSPSDSERMPGRLEVSLYRIAQEALSNIIRHSGANQASVILIRQNGTITLLIEDDGKGFDARKVETEQSKSLGLLGIKERTNLIGGDCDIESEQGQGTSIRIKIPVNGEKNVN
jgi:signal transduction histidine kinase